MTADTVLVGLLGLGIGVLISAVGFLLWRATALREIRRDAIRRSAAVIAGKVQEQLVPHLPGFDFDPKDARFLGSPVDYVVFDGLARGSLTRVVFLEVKTGSSALSDRELMVREAIRNRQVEWRELRRA